MKNALVLLVVGLVMTASGLAAQDAPPEPSEASEPSPAPARPSFPPEMDPLVSPDATAINFLDRYPLEPPDTRSPRTTLQSFLRGSFGAVRIWLNYGEASPDYYDQRRRLGQWATRTMDLSEAAPAQRDDDAERALILLAEVFSRIEMPEWETIPGPEEVATDPIERWVVPHTEIAVTLVKEGPRRREYLLSADTVERADEFWEKTRHLPLRPGTIPRSSVLEYFDYPGWMIPRPWVEALPGWARVDVLDHPIWKWMASLLLVGLAFVFFIVAYRLSLPRREDDPEWALRGPFLAILVMVLARTVDTLVDDQIGIEGSIYAVFETLVVVVFWIGIGWLTLAVGTLLARVIIASPRIKSRSVDAHLIRVATRVVSLAVLFVVILQAAAELGIPLSATLTGVGVGGIAVALAARPTLENFIGSLTLYADRPVRIGDLCRFGDRFGWVQDIGLRSTRIRTLERTVATIPNAVFASQEIVNYTRRDRFLIWTTLGVRYETTRDQMQVVLTRLRELVASHQRLLEADSRVRLRSFGDYSLDIDFFAYANAGSWLEYLAIREDVMLHVMRILEEAGVSVAFPSQTTYLGRDQGPDSATRDTAAAEVKGWVEEGRLPFPDLVEEEAERLRGTLAYPPAASRPPEGQKDDS